MVVRQTEKGIEIVVAPKDHRGADTVVALEADGPASRIKAVDGPRSPAKAI